ncbi:MAG: RNA methyltransferase [Tenericutes bacterium HGW-Tenericutes-1]|jgi:putative N6-adenine-specific DNA methylase|nr:MAG: RNA methyltransferase [Tenericutes bacterium HGW-Tenericutes-1]
MYELIATTTFGIEAVAKRELINLGFEILRTENGKVTFLSDISGIAKANLWLRSVDRVLLKVAEFKAMTFDQLFNQTAMIPWEEYLPKDAIFPVNGSSVKSTLFSISDCQALVKKAIVERLKQHYDVAWFPETGDEYIIKVSMVNDIATITLDTSGVALHKRGYRQNAVTAPLKETLAASMIMLSYWNKERVLFDPFCGSGTIPIEAAMIAKNIAPGLYRDFAAKHWSWIGEEVWKAEIKNAFQAIDHESNIKIYASDIDASSIEAAKENAEEAGVIDCIEFQVSDFKAVDYAIPYAVLVTNPPYGDRLTEENYQINQLYQDFGKLIDTLSTWSIYVITSNTNFPNLIKRKLDRERKLYNGNIETHYFQYYGPKPPLK